MIPQVPGFTYVDDGNFGGIFVPTVETVRLSFLLDGLVERRHGAMLVGPAGTGKTSILRDKLRGLDPEALLSCSINLNSFTTADQLQNILEAPLEKKSGARFGPPGGKRLIYLVDDLNMPFVDKYGTQAPIALLRQALDYGGWYDRGKVLLKEVAATQMLAAMNPTAGSFSINPRMQRHFATFAVQMPSAEQLTAIYTAIVGGHLAPFDGEVAKLGAKVAAATVELHQMVTNTFLPTAVKFHYQFNLRDLSNVAQVRPAPVIGSHLRTLHSRCNIQ